MELELWLQAIHTALENNIHHFHWIFIPDRPFKYDYIIRTEGDVKGDEDHGWLIYRTDTPIDSMQENEAPKGIYT